MTDVGESKKKVVEPVTAEGFATVVAGISRFLSKLSAYGPFQDAKLGLAEWSMLNELSREPRASKKLSKDLGVTKQRVNQLTESLKKAGYIMVTPAKPGADARTGDAGGGMITLTAEGKTQLAAINDRLTPVLAKGLQGKERAMQMATKSLKALTRMVTEPKSPELMAKRKERRGRKGGKEEDAEDK